MFAKKSPKFDFLGKMFTPRCPFPNNKPPHLHKHLQGQARLEALYVFLEDRDSKKMLSFVVKKRGMPSSKLTWQWNIPISIGNTSSNGGFPIAMLVYRRGSFRNFCERLSFQYTPDKSFSQFASFKRGHPKKTKHHLSIS